MEPDKTNDSKFFFKIGELVEITGIPSSKIRYWTKKYKELSSQLRTNDETSHKLYHKNSILPQEAHPFSLGQILLAS